ncbi:MAG: hypothetical protein HY037_00220 [Nitrospirae bacterium]|nr:hypothetical protein [Candidatus Troglogloeales bacterium]
MFQTAPLKARFIADIRLDFLMRIIVNLKTLLVEEKISQTEFEKYSRLSTKGTESFVSNILMGLGFIAARSDLLFLIFPAWSQVTFGLSTLILGIWLYRTRQQWALLGTICILLGGVILIRF